MIWTQKSSAAIQQKFDGLGETDRVFSNVIAINFEKVPDQFPITISGSATCPGCQQSYPFAIEAYRSFSGSSRITCTDSACGDVYDVHAPYRPGWDLWGDEPPIYIYADMYTTLQGQTLKEIALEISEVKQA